MSGHAQLVHIHLVSNLASTCMHSVQQLENQLPETFTMLTQDKESFRLEYQSKRIHPYLNHLVQYLPQPTYLYFTCYSQTLNTLTDCQQSCSQLVKFLTNIESFTAQLLIQQYANLTQQIQLLPTREPHCPQSPTTYQIHLSIPLNLTAQPRQRLMLLSTLLLISLRTFNNHPLPPS
ncbi:hypothetical protein SS50377_21630 [Spironucleus salmonicida]|uniref:Uncharacterized protein n=1 Tax=Spironucleus salmonicida TaxID=348837 RepID=A0A9P8LXI4_9EUKA|nr:hypothetical protein SS50377_21630 [Spironucleus salmonicida]